LFVNALAGFFRDIQTAFTGSLSASKTAIKAVMHDRKLESTDTADMPSAAVRFILNPAATDAATNLLTRIGGAADAISRAAKVVANATQPAKLSKARSALAWAGASAFADLLGRLFRHR
jgi:hypothetical protein